MESPYKGRPRKSFWKTGVAEQSVETLNNLYQPKFKIDKNLKIATLGSCFAQHIARNMRSRGYQVVDVEPPPPGLSGVSAQAYGFGLFSVRIGNVYVVRQLLQLFNEAFGMWSPQQAVWKKGDRFFDALRPSVEPEGLETRERVILHRESHLRAVKRMFLETDVFVFTLGLTESWIHKKSGTVYPTAPGTIAGSYDPDVFEFKNFTTVEILNDFKEFISCFRRVNPNVKMLLTVSPVPLTATATDDHVLVATTYSKSVLRAVAGELASEYDFIDYFPSYDLITSSLSRGDFYLPNLRSVSSRGVNAAMGTFFSSHGEGVNSSIVLNLKEGNGQDSVEDDVFCEDVLLEAFGK